MSEEAVEQVEETGIVNDAGEAMSQSDIEDAISDKEGTKEERPEWLPEKFKTPEDMAKSYSELEKNLKSKGTIAPDEYKLDEGIDVREDDEVFTSFQEAAKEANLTNDQMNSVLKFAQESGLLDNPDPEEEMKKLGSDKEKIMQSLESYSSKLSEDEQKAMASMVYTAEQARLLNKIIRTSTTDVPTKVEASTEDIKSVQQQLNDLLSDPTIRDDHSKQAQANELAQKLSNLKNNK